MTDQWFYRMFGEDFGPVPLDKLREMADQGTIGLSDEVRSADSNRWMQAGTVKALGLSSHGGGTAVATADNFDTATDLSTNRVGLDDWYSLIHGQELGPFTFEELVKYTEQGNVSADDEVKLGVNGKWRRIGSIGRLVAVLPYQPVESKTPLPGTKSRREAKSKTAEFDSRETNPAMPTVGPVPSVDVRATYEAAYELAKAQIAKSMMAHAESEFKLAEESAKAELAWAFAPNVDPNWSGWMGSVEFGPVPFMQVFALAKAGQLKPSDFIRNGMAGQYFPASNAPGLFNAVATLAKATEALRLATAQAQTAASLASPAPEAPVLTVVKTPPAGSASRVSEVAPTTPQRGLGRTPPVIATVTERPNSSSRPENSAGSESLRSAATPEPEPEPVSVERKSVSVPPEPLAVAAPMSSNYSTSQSSISSYSTTRPYPNPVRSAPKPVRSSRNSSSLSDSVEFLKEPKVQGTVAVLAVFLLFVGWQFLPKNNAALVKHFRELKLIADEIKAKRTANSTDFASLMVQAEKTKKAITTDLAKKASRDNPVSLSLLWAARDELPRVMTAIKASSAAPSKAEDTFIARLRDAAQQMKLKDWGGLPAPSPAELAANVEQQEIQVD